MKILFCLLLFSLCYQLSLCEQPYFPAQIVFSPDNGTTTIAIDEINQRAYLTFPVNSLMEVRAYVMEHFPYVVPDSPQSKHYVQLSLSTLINFCSYETYWEYSTNLINQFPFHWGNDSSYKIKNYINFKYQMIHSNNASKDEDYWYSSEKCQVDSGKTYPCEEIYFKKNTDIPIRSTLVERTAFYTRRVITNYTIISIGKPSDKYFETIPTNWYPFCRDVDLGIFYDPTGIRLNLQESTKVQISLSTPPHFVNGNDTVTVQFKTSERTTCFTWTPKQLVFNSKNFNEKQTVTITRLAISEQTLFTPIFEGGDYDLIPSETYSLWIR